MKITFLDAATLGNDVLDQIPVLFDPLGDVTVYQSTTADEFADHVKDADVLILNKLKMTSENLPLANALKLICVAATGYDNIDLSYCRIHGIAVCNVVGYSTQCVSQVTIGMALSLLTHLFEYKQYVESGEYTRKGIANCLFPIYHEIAGKTWGIVGFGNIGKQVGKVASAMGCRVLVNKRTPIDGWECVDFDTICRESDILSFHVPLSDSTKGLLDRDHIAMMKPDALVINVARGAVIDEEALAKAVLDGRLGGIGIDVYSTEPMPLNHPLQAVKNMPNVILTPHMAWGGYETRVRVLKEMASNVTAFLKQEKRCRVD